MRYPPHTRAASWRQVEGQRPARGTTADRRGVDRRYDGIGGWGRGRQGRQPAGRRWRRHYTSWQWGCPWGPGAPPRRRHRGGAVTPVPSPTRATRATEPPRGRRPPGAAGMTAATAGRAAPTATAAAAPGSTAISDAAWRGTGVRQQRRRRRARPPPLPPRGATPSSVSRWRADGAARVLITRSPPSSLPSCPLSLPSPPPPAPAPMCLPSSRKAGSSGHPSPHRRCCHMAVPAPRPPQQPRQRVRPRG